MSPLLGHRPSLWITHKNFLWLRPWCHKKKISSGGCEADDGGVAATISARLIRRGRPSLRRAPCYNIVTPQLITHNYACFEPLPRKN
jgi:hypothetical protein